MKPASRATVLWLQVPLWAVCLALYGCQSHRSDGAPSIEFTKIPPAAQGGDERGVDTIAGRVRGSHPGEQMVIYAHSGPCPTQLPMMLPLLVYPLAHVASG